MAIVFSDTFTEASGTPNLNTHTPDVGSGWAAASGTINIDSTNDRCDDGNVSNGNRYNISSSLGITAYDVQGDFRNATGGTFVFIGPRGRQTSSTATGALEFLYDWGAAGGSFNLAAAQSVEAWTGSPTTMRLAIRAGTATGFANGVSKVTTTSDPNPSTGYFAGILLGNFDGSARDITCDNFSIDNLITAKNLGLLGVG